MASSYPEKQREQQNQAELEQLRFFCKKIIQAYRIRLQCLRKRHEVLTELERDSRNKPDFRDIQNFKRVVKHGWNKDKHEFKKVLRNGDAFYSVLDTNLKRERKVLEIARREDVEAESNIVDVVKQLKRYKTKFGESMNTIVKDIDLETGRRLSLSDIITFLTHMIRFLNLMNQDLAKIEVRIEVEEKFLRKKDSKHFDDFILAWEDEMKANVRLVKHFKKVLNSNKKVIKTGTREGETMLFGGGFGGIVAIIGSLAIGGPGGPAGAIIGGGVGAVFVLIGFINYIGSIFNEELTSVYKDERLLEHLEEINAIKRPFWKKIF